jgi:hypothetical protein
MIRLPGAIGWPLEGFSAFSASALVQKIQLRPEPDTRPQRPSGNAARPVKRVRSATSSDL